jgi:CRP-like cAMP-binding protein
MVIYRVFKGLSKSEIETVFDSGVIRSVNAKMPVFTKGEAGHEMYLILTGKVDIIDEYEGNQDRIAELRPGEIFGEMAIFDIFEKEQVRSAHALAVEPSQLLVLSEHNMNRLVNKKMPKQFLVNIVVILSTGCVLLQACSWT